MAEADPIRASLVPRLVFSTDQLPAGLDDLTRFRLWRDFQEEHVGSLEVTYGEEQPFWGRMEFAQFGACGIGRYSGAFTGVTRTARDVARDGRQSFSLALSHGSAPVSVNLRGRHALLNPGSATLVSYADPGQFQFSPGFSLLEVSLPHSELSCLAAHAESLIARPFDPGQPALRHLQRYVEILFGSDEADTDPLLIAHIEATLLDLIALAVGAQRDAAHIATTRGLRAARLAAILAEIKTGFADAAFSVERVAKRVGLSPRYVQVLLHETGETFTERVLELRLQRARSMLASPLHRDSQVGQIAYACGFNQVSHFNHCFRRRFGLSPTAARGGAKLV
ncbi:MAG: AraC family transcriptional regulator [Methyloceanibacter sp.]|uniref:AraC family transcriptional regulator n=1 Tax=Methyloceanibacter sp. TaxID=1965321 RepID=UPI003D6CB222